jgi:hypothetical protein
MNSIEKRKLRRFMNKVKDYLLGFIILSIIILILYKTAESSLTRTEKARCELYNYDYCQEK